MKDHLSELHSNEMAFIAEIRKIHDIENGTCSSSEVFLRDLINENTDEIKNIKVKFSDMSKSFYEKNQSSMHVVKTADNKKKTDKLKPVNDQSKPSTSTKNDTVEKKQIEKPLFLIGDIYSLSTEP